MMLSFTQALNQPYVCVFLKRWLALGDSTFIMRDKTHVSDYVKRAHCDGPMVIHNRLESFFKLTFVTFLFSFVAEKKRNKLLT